MKGDMSPWDLACQRLSLRAELRHTRDRLQDVPSEHWLSPEGLDSSERRFLEKIDKLLALSSSSNEHEAALAMERVQALLETQGYERHREGVASRFAQRYATAGSKNASSFVSLTLSLGVSKISSLHDALSGLLIKHYQVRAVWGRDYDVADAEEGMSLTLLGRREHVLLAEHVFDFLDQQLTNLWQRARKDRKLPAGSRLSYQLGLVSGFRGKLDAAKAAREQRDAETNNDIAALVRLEWQDLGDYVASRYPHLTSRTKSSLSLKSDVYAAGKEEGARLTVHTPVTSRADAPTAPPKQLNAVR
jgi:hypothetical protein